MKVHFVLEPSIVLCYKTLDTHHKICARKMNMPGSLEVSRGKDENPEAEAAVVPENM